MCLLLINTNKKLPVHCDLVRSNTLSSQLEEDKQEGLHKRAIAPSLLPAFSFLPKPKFSGQVSKTSTC